MRVGYIYKFGITASLTSQPIRTLDHIRTLYFSSSSHSQKQHVYNTLLLKWTLFIIVDGKPKGIAFNCL